MKLSNIQDMTTDQLVANFKECSFQQADAIFGDDSKTSNKLYARLTDIRNELRRRGPDARRALLPLLNCPGSGPGPIVGASAAQCRYNAAHELLAVEPERAHAVLNALAAKGPAYQQFEARNTLGFLEDGTLKPM